MAKLTLKTFASAFNSWQNFNSNNTATATAMENTLSRDGTAPNQMGAVLDMNSNRIINLPAPATDNEPLRRIDATNGLNITVQSKNSYDQPAIDILSTPPGSPGSLDRYLVGNSPTGTWSGMQGRIATWDTTLTIPAWTFSPAPTKQGQKIYVTNQVKTYVYRNTWWNQLKEGMDVYQNFADIPTGTLINGMILATGQQFIIQGPGAAGGVVQNSRWEPTDNSYGVVNFPSKNLLMGMSGSWRVGHSGFGSLTLAAGTYQSGAIISKMVHSEFLEQTRPGISIWGGSRQTANPSPPPPFLGYLADANLQYALYQIDTNYPLHTTGTTTSCELVISGNTARCYSEKYRFQNAYNDDMISGSVGDDESGNLGYLYFQTGGVIGAFNPYVYEIYAKSLPAPQEILQDPKTIIPTGNLPQLFSASVPFGTATEVCRFTPANFANYTFEVDVLAEVGPTIFPGYAQAYRKYVVNVLEYAAGIVVSSPFPVFAEQATSTASGTVALSCAFTVVISGTDVILKANVSRTGTDSSSYQPIVLMTIKSYGSGAIFTA